MKDECDEYLPPEMSRALRKAVLDGMNDYYDVCLDIMRSLDGGEYVLNQDYIERRLDHIVEMLEDGS